MKSFSIIVGYRGSDRAIGINGRLPWKITKDMDYFRKITTQIGGGCGGDGDVENPRMNAVIMGRNTFESLNYTPLKKRVNFVCTSTDAIDMPEFNLFFVKTLEEALECCKKMSIVAKVFVIGGEKLYNYAIHHPCCEEIIVNEFYPCVTSKSTYIETIVADTFFPEINLDKYEIILDYNSIDSISDIDRDILSVKSQFVKIRYKKYIRKTV
jgi:dihydrofolate reductase